MKHIAFVALTTAACACFLLLRNKKILPAVVWAVFGALFLGAIVIFFRRVDQVVSTPNVYDFMAFFLWGKTAVKSYDFYLPENLQLVFNSLQVPPANYGGFDEEILNVGFLYPPPTMLYFAPLGLLSYNAGMISWAVFNLLLAIGCIYLIYDLFFRKDGLKGLMLVTILFLLLKAVLDTVTFLQTNFIILFYLLLIKKYEEKKIAGVFVALAMFTKPYLVILILYFVVKKKWNTVIYFVVTAVVMVALTLLLFGWAPFNSYVFNSPSHRMPLWAFSEGINQSLHAVLIRMGLISVGKSLVYGAILVVITFFSTLYVLRLAKKNLYDYVLPFLLLIGLIVYPGTLSHYGVLLLFIVFQFFDKRSQLQLNNPILITTVVAIFYSLSRFSIFSAFCFLLLVILFESFRKIKTVQAG